MKTTLRFLIVPAFAILAFTACNKESVSTEQVISAAVSSDGSYSYELPASSDQLSITQQPLHADKVNVTSSGTTKALFTYTPVSTYSGTDEVKVASSETASPSTGHTCSGGGHHRPDQTTYVFKIQVNAAK